MPQTVRSTRRLLTRGAVAGVAAAAVGLLGLPLAAPAYAGPPGTWTTLGKQGVQNSSQPGLLRVGKTLTAAWTTVPSAGKNSILTRTVSAKGKAGAQQTAVESWSSLAFDPKLVNAGGERQLIFGGVRTTQTSGSYDGTRIYSAVGDSWSLSPQTRFPFSSNQAYGGYGYGAVVLPDGRTVVAYSLNGTIYLSDDSGKINTINLPGNKTTYNTSLVRDRASGAVWVVVFVQDGDTTAATKTGVWAHQFDMSSGLVPEGDWVRLADSVTSTAGRWTADNKLQDQPVAAPAGGGAYVAYAMGNPTKQIRVQRLGSSAGFTVAAAGARKIALTSYGSRVWLSWAGTGGQLWSARSNLVKTKVGKATRVVTPGQGEVYQLSSEGSTGRLDLVVTTQAFPKPMSVLHTQVLAGLTVKVSKKKIKSAKGGKEVITVRDVGDPVAGAKVKLGKQVKKTKANGKVTFKIKKGTAKGKKSIVVKKGGYAPGKAKFKVT